MQLKLKVNSCWLQKAVICLAFFGILSAKDACAYGLPPLITVPPLGVTVQNGDTATFTATVGLSLTPLTISWRLNGEDLTNAHVANVTVPILGTTISTLTITNASSANGGYYSVKVQNNGGSVTSGNALLVVLGTPVSTVISNVNLLPSQCGMISGGFRLNLLKPATSNCVIEATTDFKNWSPLYTNTSGSTNISYVDAAATNLTLRYYRARLQ